MNDADTLVIGSGMGGLTAAALLARVHGERVLVLERHFRAGGFTHTFSRPGGYHWDVGVHYLGELESGMPRQVMDVVTGGATRWEKMKDPFERLVFPGFQFDIRAGRERFREDLCAAFPTERKAITRYVDDVGRAAGWIGTQGLATGLPGILRGAARTLGLGSRALALQTTQAWLSTHVADPKLRAILGARWGDYGLPPGLGAFGMHAVIARHYLEGAYYPVGSAASIARGAADVIAAAGGAIRVNAEVAEIMVERGRAIGVRLASGEVLRAKRVISDAGVRNTYLKLLPRDVPIPFRDALAAVPRSMAHVTLYLGLSRSPATLGIHGENYWLHDDTDHDALHRDRDQLMEGVVRHAYLSFPSLKDPAAKAHTAEIVVPMRAEPFAAWSSARWKRRGDDYEALKARITETLLTYVDRHVPGLRNLVAFTEVSTPLSTEHFTGHPGGEIYGIPCTPDRFTAPWQGTRTPVRDLWIAGADAIAPGVVGAMMGGLAAVVGARGLSTFPGIQRAAKQHAAAPSDRAQSVVAPAP